MPAIFADQRLSQPIRWNRHVLYRIAQSRTQPVALVNIVLRRSVGDSHSDYRQTRGSLLSEQEVITPLPRYTNCYALAWLPAD